MTVPCADRTLSPPSLQRFLPHLPSLSPGLARLRTPRSSDVPTLWARSATRTRRVRRTPDAPSRWKGWTPTARRSAVRPRWRLRRRCEAPSRHRFSRSPTAVDRHRPTGATWPNRNGRRASAANRKPPIGRQSVRIRIPTAGTRRATTAAPRDRRTCGPRCEIATRAAATTPWGITTTGRGRWIGTLGRMGGRVGLWGQQWFVERWGRMLCRSLLRAAY